jgi:hypothetical protein
MDGKRLLVVAAGRRHDLVVAVVKSGSQEIRSRWHKTQCVL